MAYEFSHMSLKISACILVRTSQNGFVIMLHVMPAMAADTEYSSNEPSCQPRSFLNFLLVASYRGKYNVWKKGVQNKEMVYPRNSPRTPSYLTTEAIVLKP